LGSLTASRLSLARPVESVPSDHQGPEGRPLNVSPARAGLGIDSMENPERRRCGTIRARDFKYVMG
jgi:hypothetical protein